MSDSAFLNDDTIAAIATPIGEGGLAVIRISGASATQIATQIFKAPGSKLKALTEVDSHTLHYGFIEQDGKQIDEVMLAVMRAPRTFTREDVVEVSCHGGMLSTKFVLDAILQAGARIAEPGEFTRRAFLNGRIDLAQAEAVADLIHSRTDLALTAANEQLAGKLSKRIEELRDAMMITLAHVEAHIDFPDEDIDPSTLKSLIRRLKEGRTFMEELLATADQGQVLRNGIRAAIVGRPNAGKSSLLNQLLGHDRAIVSEIAGTTRDTIEATANVRGIPVIFVDTAGLREASDSIEKEGIRRSRESIERAELVLHVIDRSTPLSEEDRHYLETTAHAHHMVVLNKCDLPSALELPAPPDRSAIEITCAKGEGIESLRDAIQEHVWSGHTKAGNLGIAINSRHQNALERAHEATNHTISCLESDQTLELAAMDLRIAVNAVGEIVGKTTTDDLLDSIFTQFCLGK
ncbi:tRNA uridine-5-carboxymethylaminomethyl(34) synthesis GTPase MnmE [bacterium]|nr:tRNA uridine-5-carboxymethylaminomethyl(34) synthesis GTPase MnmE [bacterium]